MFIPNPNNYLCINHIDGNKLNNNISNLEWCTYGHNEKEAYKIGIKKPAWKGKFNKEHPRTKSINQYDLNDNFIKKWDCMSEVESKLGISVSSLSNCCKEKAKRAGNYKWRYVNE